MHPPALREPSITLPVATSMLLPRVVRRWCCLAGLFALAASSLAAAEAGFSTTLPPGLRTATGLDRLTADERTILDMLVASDLAQARQLRLTALADTFSSRHAGQGTGLERLEAGEVAALDEQVADLIATQPLPKERPRLRDDQVVSLKSRLQVHGGMSFTYGWASGGRDFRVVSGWVSYFDPATGIGLEIGVSRASGDLPYYYYPGWYRAYPGYADRWSHGDYSRPAFMTSVDGTAEPEPDRGMMLSQSARPPAGSRRF
jgi:hypothetical protein